MRLKLARDDGVERAVAKRALAYTHFGRRDGLRPFIVEFYRARRVNSHV